jgi:hypothetical protein
LLKLQAAIQSAWKHIFDLPACVPHRQAGIFAPSLGQAKVAKSWERWPKALDTMCSDVYRANAFPHMRDAFAMNTINLLLRILRLIRTFAPHV